MLAAPVNEFLYRTSNQATPSTTPGTSLTPGTNTYPAYAEILAGASIAHDCFGIYVKISGVQFSGEARDALLRIGVDPAGGTSWTTVADGLLCSCAANVANTGAAVEYYFPVFVKAGSSIAGSVSVNHATVRTALVQVALYGKPTHPEVMRYGHVIEAIGVVAASSRGTIIVPGATGAEGSWTELGTTTRQTFWWQCMVGCNDATMNNRSLLVDLAYGDASNKHLIIENHFVSTGATELIVAPRYFHGERLVPAGATIYGRVSNSGANDAEYSMAAYGVW